MERLHKKFRWRMPSMTVASKGSVQNQFKINEAPIQETHETEEVVPQFLRFTARAWTCSR